MNLVTPNSGRCATLSSRSLRFPPWQTSQLLQQVTALKQRWWSYAEGFNVSMRRLELLNTNDCVFPLHCVKNSCFTRDLAKAETIRTICSSNILARNWIKSHQWGAGRAHTPSKVLPHKTGLRLGVYSPHCPVVNQSSVLPSFHFKRQRRKESFWDHIEVRRRIKPKNNKKRERKKKKILIHTVLLLHVRLKSKNKVHMLLNAAAGKTCTLPCRSQCQIKPKQSGFVTQNLDSRVWANISSMKSLRHMKNTTSSQRHIDSLTSLLSSLRHYSKMTGEYSDITWTFKIKYPQIEINIGYGGKWSLKRVKAVDKNEQMPDTSVMLFAHIHRRRIKEEFACLYFSIKECGLKAHQPE